MKIVIFNILVISLLSYSCAMKVDKTSIEKWKQEIVDTEQNFANMAQKEGVQKAFLSYAAEDAVLLRNDKLVIGKSAIEHYFNQPSNFKDVSLLWKPDFVDVSASGDLGYTYGNYTFSYVDTTGNNIQSTGVFHTVWKRDSKGNWKFVWD
jgi:ketosteroid isomerase-like protein